MTATQGDTNISHLFFVDDSILFCKASKKEWKKVRRVLNIYELALGQKINNKKSSLFFNSNTSNEARSVVIQAVGGVICGNYDKYLGLPALISRSKYNTFWWLKKECEKDLELEKLLPFTS